MKNEGKLKNEGMGAIDRSKIIITGPQEISI